MKNEIAKTRNEVDLEVLKKYCADNDRLLQLIRATFFGFEMSKAEKKEVETAFSDKAFVLAFRRKLYPLIDKDDQIGNCFDFWSGTEKSIVGANTEQIIQVVSYKSLLLRMLDQGMNRLQDSSVEPVDIEFYDLDNDPLQVKLIARNIFLGTVENCLVQIKIVCNPAYSRELVEKMQKMNSAK